MNTVQNSSPQILSGTVALAAGMTQTITMNAMASRSHRWLRLDELSVSFFPTVGATANNFSRNLMMGSLVNIRSRAYRQDLMLDYVPTWLLGPRLHAAAEVAEQTSGITNYGQFETYRWRFPKPFYLPSGSAFISQLQRNGSTRDIAAGGTINATVAVRGMQMGEGEARAAMAKTSDGGNPIPYIASYAPSFLAQSYYTNKSNNLDLANPFLTPLQLQRMTARLSQNNNVGGSSSPDYGGGLRGCQVRLTDTRTVICEWSDVLDIFPSSQMAWTHTRVLQPAEYITAELKNTVAGLYAPQVAIIGYRNEVLS